MPYAMNTAIGKCLSLILKTAVNIEIDGDSNDDRSYMAAYIQTIALTPEQCQTIEQASIGQTNNVWMQQRKGRLRITSCNAYSIYSKVNTVMMKWKVGLVFTLVQIILICVPDISHLPAVIYCNQLERNGNKYFYVQDIVKHDTFVLYKPEVYASTDLPFLIASPDYIMNCNCCSISVVEIKCSVTLTALSVENELKKMEFLENLDGKPRTDTIHRYWCKWLL